MCVCVVLETNVCSNRFLCICLTNQCVSQQAKGEKEEKAAREQECMETQSGCGIDRENRVPPVSLSLSTRRQSPWR